METFCDYGSAVSYVELQQVAWLFLSNNSEKH